ncbi:nicotinate phosphoribosyltransferase [Jatrophihabitans sp.]|uniref:nicotinate phosphoribosyltransferase n=1 Tax=Jatrophihabitans sp. TaxID=1932789 RepID=UPI002C918466|nr:nicotinate phosphoribosyltransferase [Jatrophihabitans sp.]
MAASSTALLTDHYELTMLTAALADGSAERRCTFEVFTRRLPNGRRFGVAAGLGRLLPAIEDFRFPAEQLDRLAAAGVIDARAADYLAGYRFAGDISAYAEGEPYFPYSPILSVTGSFAEAVVLETLVLSVLNHDSAIAAGAARMVVAAGDRPLIEMGSRRTHEQAALACARAAYLVGFSATSNLAAGACYGIPTTGTAAHAFTLLHDSERAAFAAQLDSLGLDTTLLVDTYDISRGIATAIEVAGPGLGAIRIDSGDLAVMAHQSRAQLDSLGATGTRIVVSGDLDEYAIAALAAAPVDSYGAGTAVVTGSGAPTAGLVYKLVEVDGRPVSKRSENKGSPGGAKLGYRRHRASGTATEELVVQQRAGFSPADGDRLLSVPVLRGGRPVAEVSLEQSRTAHRAAMTALPWEALKLSAGEPGLAVSFG